METSKNTHIKKLIIYLKLIDFIKKRFKENKNKFKQGLFNDNYKNSQEDNIDEFFETI